MDEKQNIQDENLPEENEHQAESETPNTASGVNIEPKVAEENLSPDIKQENQSNSVIPTTSNEKPETTLNMEVHKHPHHVMHTKNWKEYLLEFLMIFLAVTLGFFAESYREYSAEKSRAEEYARSLVHDLEKDTAMVRLNIRGIELLNLKIDSLANFLRGKKIDDFSNVELFAYTNFICLYRPYSWSRATLDEIKSSGSLRYFDNDSIIMRVSAYDAFTKHLDADFNGDEGRSDRVAEKRNHIVDLSYDLDSLNFRMHPDSAIKMFSKEIQDRHGDLQLLTDDINDIKSLLNDYKTIKRQLTIRGSYELPKLVADAETLILLLKKEYDFSTPL